MARYMVDGGRIVLVLSRDEALGLRHVVELGQQAISAFPYRTTKQARGAGQAYKALRSAVLPPIDKLTKD